MDMNIIIYILINIYNIDIISNVKYCRLYINILSYVCYKLHGAYTYHVLSVLHLSTISYI